jgi:hypothetical protein
VLTSSTSRLQVEGVTWEGPCPVCTPYLDIFGCPLALELGIWSTLL